MDIWGHQGICDAELGIQKMELLKPDRWERIGAILLLYAKRKLSAERLTASILYQISWIWACRRLHQRIVPSGSYPQALKPSRDGKGSILTALVHADTLYHQCVPTWVILTCLTHNVIVRHAQEDQKVPLRHSLTWLLNWFGMSARGSSLGGE